MIDYSLRTESPSGKAGWWHIITTIDYQLNENDKSDDINNSELVMLSKEQFTGYIFCLLPSEFGYYILLKDEISDKSFITNKVFKIDEACQLITSLSSISSTGLYRVLKLSLIHI